MDYTSLGLIAVTGCDVLGASSRDYQSAKRRAVELCQHLNARIETVQSGLLVVVENAGATLFIHSLKLQLPNHRPKRCNGVHHTHRAKLAKGSAATFAIPESLVPALSILPSSAAVFGGQMSVSASGRICHKHEFEIAVPGAKKP